MNLKASNFFIPRSFFADIYSEYKITILCFQVGVVREESLVFRVLSTEEIDEHLNAISEHN